MPELRRILTFIIYFFDQFRRLIEHLLMDSFVVDKNHVEVDIISCVPVFQGYVGLLFDFGDGINVAEGQEILLN